VVQGGGRTRGESGHQRRSIHACHQRLTGRPESIGRTDGHGADRNTDRSAAPRNDARRNAAQPRWRTRWWTRGRYGRGADAERRYAATTRGDAGSHSPSDRDATTDRHAPTDHHHAAPDRHAAPDGRACGDTDPDPDPNT